VYVKILYIAEPNVKEFNTLCTIVNTRKILITYVKTLAK